MRIRLNQSWGETRFPIWAQPAQEGAHEDEQIVWYVIWQGAQNEQPGFTLESAGTPCYFESLETLMSSQPGIVDWYGFPPPSDYQ